MSNFKIGDKVRILGTATEEKYESSDIMISPGWVPSMQPMVGKVGTVVSFPHFASSADKTLQVEIEDSYNNFWWFTEDLIPEEEFQKKALDVTLSIRVECDQALEKLQELINLVTKLKEKL